MSTTTATGARAPLPFISSADVLLPCPDGTFAASLLFFQDVLGFAVASISPADAPTRATLVAYGLRVRLCPPTSSSEPLPTLRLLCSDPAAFGGAPSLVAPNGVRVLLAPEVVAFPVAEGALEDLTVASQDDWVVGRAGMEYRDLIPGRLGGRLIASHIRITRGGPVADYVHYHAVQFQMIFVAKGWVELLYEDCGPAFTAVEGDLLLQPPRIRHRVLAASVGLEVVELARPAAHETHADLGLPLPNCAAPVAGREWSGQRFLHHAAGSAAPLVDAAARLHSSRGLRCSDLGLAGAATGLLLETQPDGPPGALEVTAPAGGAAFIFVLSGAWAAAGAPLAQGAARTVVGGGTATVEGNGRLLYVCLAEV